MYKLTVFIPDTHVEAVKDALFEAGAGKIGHYACCSWQVLGQGQFMPTAGHHDFIGQTDRLETVPEWRVEMVVAAAVITDVMVALKQAHPYETPAYDVIKVENL